MTRYQYLSLAHFLEHGVWPVAHADWERQICPSVPVGWTMAREPSTGHTNYKSMYRESNALFQGHESCDCHFDKPTNPARIENRYYRDPDQNVSLSFFFWKGRRGFRGHWRVGEEFDHRAAEADPCPSPADCSTPVAWEAPTIEDFLRDVVAPMRPDLLVMNCGLWWFKPDLELNKNPYVWKSILTAGKEAVTRGKEAGEGRVLWKTTTQVPNWRKRDNEGVDTSALVWSNEIDKLPRELARNHGWGLFDAYRATKEFQDLHCSGGGQKFFADDMHMQPFVQQELNTILYNVHCPVVARNSESGDD